MAGFMIWGLLLLTVSVYGSTYKQDKCLEPLDPGPCRANMPSWGYDNDLEQCVKFTYGGCGGNANNFITEEDCIDKCEHPRSCFDENEQVWYANRESKDGGAGCGGCTCNDGLFECGSCNLVPLVCSRINCDNECEYGYQTDELGCDTCECKPEPDAFMEKLRFYCNEVCGFCTRNGKIKCPAECDCYKM